MTEREKIIEVIAPYVSAYGDDDAIANALIAAGIGDVEEAKRKVFVYSREIMHLDGILKGAELRAKVAEKAFKKAAYRAEVAEYRAEVAERAFKELCIDKIFGQDDEPSIKWTWDFYKARAEKELAEGKKK